MHRRLLHPVINTVALLGLLAVALIPLQPSERGLRITAPPSGAAGERISVHVTASTDGHLDESIAFLHIEYSTDGGNWWNALAYETDQGAGATRAFDIELGPAPSVTLIRSRAAFRSAAAGDVDYLNNQIDWGNSWENWQQPPARIARVEVR